MNFNKNIFIFLYVLCRFHMSTTFTQWEIPEQLLYSFIFNISRLLWFSTCHVTCQWIVQGLPHLHLGEAPVTPSPSNTSPTLPLPPQPRKEIRGKYSEPHDLVDRELILQKKTFSFFQRKFANCVAVQTCNPNVNIFNSPSPQQFGKQHIKACIFRNTEPIFPQQCAYSI